MVTTFNRKLTQKIIIRFEMFFRILNIVINIKNELNCFKTKAYKVKGIVIP